MLYALAKNEGLAATPASGVSVDMPGFAFTVSAMITLTSRAAQQVRTLQTELGDASKCLRVFVESGGCSGFQYGMSFDVSKEGDQRLSCEGVEFLVDATSLAYMDGSVIDFDDGLHGKGFEIKNPNAQSTCGCGKSFN